VTVFARDRIAFKNNLIILPTPARDPRLLEDKTLPELLLILRVNQNQAIILAAAIVLFGVHYVDGRDARLLFSVAHSMPPMVSMQPQVFCHTSHAFQSAGEYRRHCAGVNGSRESV
jgi:hypothetical protein